jgi:WD40 repeat protein
VVNRLRGAGNLGLFVIGSIALAALLATVGVVLLVTRNVAVADNVSSILSFTLAVVTAGISLTVWYRADLGRGLRQRKSDELEAAKSRPEDHWVRSARGAESGSSLFFVGRKHALYVLDKVVKANQPALAVVLGMPGAGKSAVLSVLVLRSRESNQLTNTLSETVPKFTIDCAVHARGKTVSDVVAELNAALGVVVPDTAHEQDNLFRALRSWKRLPVVVVDSVDESSAPGALGAFLSQLSWSAVVLAGTRPDEVARAGVASAPPVGMRTRATPVIDLSSEDYLDRDEVAAYVSARLRADERHGGYSDFRRWTDEHLREIIGREVAAAAEDNFLVAQMITDELLSRPALHAVFRGWSAAMDWPTDFAGWMERDIDRRLGIGERWLAEALIPLAFTQRDGLPLDLWLEATTAFNLDPRIGRPEVARALHVLSFYITESPLPSRSDEGSQLGYRLRHQRFADYFRRNVLTGQRERAMADVVFDSVPRTASGARHWPDMSTYARRNALAHAVRAGVLPGLLREDPLCLAVVDPADALEALSASPNTAVRDLAHVMRRAAYAADASYDTRAAQLEFHARLAGSLQLADAFGRSAQSQTWDTPWRAGGRSAAIPDGGSMSTKAVLPVTWPKPTAVVIDENFNAEALDLVSRSPLGPRIVVRDATGTGPDVWSAREIGGSIHLVVAWEDGHIRTWCLAGPSASPKVLAFSHNADKIRTVEILAGPGGIPLVAALTGDRPGKLMIWSTRGGRLETVGHDDLAGGDHAVGLRGTDSSGKLVVASLGNGLRALRLDASVEVPVIVTATDKPATLLAAEGDAREAVALISVDQEIRAVLLRNDDAEVLPQVLGNGGPSARPALWYRSGATRAAIVSDGELLLWTLLPRVELLATLSTDSQAHAAHFLNSDATLLSLSGFSGDIRILSLVNGTIGQQRLALPAGESGTFLYPIPSMEGDVATVVTRSPSGLTKVWLVDGDEPASPLDQSPLGPLTALREASDRTGGVLVATDGTPSVALWRLTKTTAEERPWMVLSHVEEVEAVALTTEAGSVGVVAFGDTRATVWTLSLESGELDSSHTWAVPSGLAEHLVVATLGANTLVAAGGLEGIDIWLASPVTNEPSHVASVNIPITAVAIAEVRDDLVKVAAADEDDVLHLITVTLDRHVVHRKTESGQQVITRCISLRNSLNATHLLTTSYSGSIRVWNIADQDATLHHELRLPEDPALALAVESMDKSLLVVTAPGGIMLWDILNNSHSATLVRTSGRRPIHLCAVGEGAELQVLCAYSSGSVSVINPRTSELLELELNCEFSQMVGIVNPNWAVGAHGSALITLRPN